MTLVSCPSRPKFAEITNIRLAGGPASLAPPTHVSVSYLLYQGVTFGRGPARSAASRNHYAFMKAPSEATAKLSAPRFGIRCLQASVAAHLTRAFSRCAMLPSRTAR